MANQSAKKKQQQIQTPIKIFTYVVYAMAAWLIILNAFFLQLYVLFHMANQSAKKNQQQIRTPIKVFTYVVYAMTAWLIIFNAFFLIGQTVSIWHFLLCLGVGYLNHFCWKTIVKYYELQAPEAADYYVDILVMNAVVSIFDPLTHYVWHMYWLILVFVLWQVAKWLWDYITPRYEQSQQKLGQNGKPKKQKKQKIKYLKH